VNLSDDWALNDEAIRNLGYMQMKKTHDAAIVIIERADGERPRFNYRRRSNGPYNGRSVRALLRDAADEARVERYELRRQRRGKTIASLPIPNATSASQPVK
jgi:hypothetical protein